MLNWQMKMLFYYVPLAEGIGMATTWPIIKNFMYANVSPEILSLSNMIEVGLTILINGSIHSDKTMEFFRTRFNWLASVHTLCFIFISLMGENYPELRFIGFAVMTSITGNLYILVFRQSMNRIWEGDKLTKLQFDTVTWNSVGALIGGSLVFVLDMSLHQALILQAFTVASSNLCDMVFFKTMKSYERKDDE